MKRVFLVLLLPLTLTFNNLFAEESKGKITGQIIDADTKEPMEFVNVVLKRQNVPGTNPIGTVTDKSGNFIILDVPAGDYNMTISYIGYTPVEKTITILPAGGVININLIALSSDAKVMDEVKVVGIRSEMKVDIDKKVFTVDQNIAASGGSATDVLSNIPSVEVDNEGGISLKGNSSVTVWINGKASGLSADNRGQILEQLPAETIEKIEVITNPSAKYSPEGTAGIINIVLKKDRKAGYYGSFQLGGDSQGGYNASANYNYSSSKLDAYASLAYRERVRKGGGFSNRLNTSGADTTFLNQKSTNSGGGGNVFTRLGMTWHVTPNDYLTIGGFAMFGNGDSKRTVNYLSDVPYSFTTSTRLTDADTKMNGGNLEFGYKHEFGKDHYLDFNITADRWGMDNTSIYKQNSVFADASEVNSYQKQIMNMNNHELEIQLDYYKKINENTKLEAGYKASIERENSPVETYGGATEFTAVPQTSLFNRFLYNQDVHALYTTYTGKLDKFGYQLGLRGEYSTLESRSPGYNQSASDVTPFKKDYFSLFPTVFLSYSLPAENELQLSYTRRIERPDGHELNPFVDITDSTNISFGNPNLLPEFSNAFELNYIKNWEKHVFSFSGYFRNTDNVIQRISYMEGNIMKSTFENISRSMSTGTELVLKDELFKMLELTSTVNVYYYKLNGFKYMPEGASDYVTGKANEDFTWNARMIASFRFPKSYSLQLTGNYNAKQIVAQGYQKANYSLDAGLRKQMKKLSFSVNARDILDSRKRKTYTSGVGYIQDSQNWWGGRMVGLTVTYSFGNMAPKRMNKGQQQEGNQGGYGNEEQ
jgi:outer membrane receptor protein involved in Fe transport